MSSMSRGELLDTILLTTVQYGLFYNKIALKGGYLLNKQLHIRQTKDIDMSLDRNSEWGNINSILTMCGQDLINRGIVYRYKIRKPEMDKKSGGIVFYDEQNKIITSIDISVQTLDFGIGLADIKLKNTEIATIIPIPSYRIERMLGDKISASFSIRQFRRVRDLYDIYCILRCCRLDIRVLTQSLEDRNFEFKYVTEYSPFSQDALKNWVHAWSKFKLVDMQYRELVKPDAIEMLKTYSVFLGEYLRLISLGMYNYYWDNGGMEWVKC